MTEKRGTAIYAINLNYEINSRNQFTSTTYDLISTLYKKPSAKLGLKNQGILPCKGN